ncbi:MAG: hypothetical protein V1782_00875, partial [Pseudomonadota bacterium]
MKKFVWISCLFLALFPWVDRSLALDALEVQAPRQTAKLNFQAIEQGKVLVSVQDKDGEAILGL